MSGTDVIGWFSFDNTTEYTAALVTITYGTLYLSTLYCASQHICKLYPVCYFSTSLMQHVFICTTISLAEMPFWTSNITSQYGCGSELLFCNCFSSHYTVLVIMFKLLLPVILVGIIPLCYSIQLYPYEYSLTQSYLVPFYSLTVRPVSVL
jgi:hypothetical protein